MEKTFRKSIALIIDSLLYLILLLVLNHSIENIFLLIGSVLLGTYIYLIHIINKYPD
jgi:hypothetical protein